MTDITDLISRLRELEAQATPGPWYAKATDDQHHMNALYVSTEPGPFEHDHLNRMDWRTPERNEGVVVAITLLQSPSLACMVDMKWDENTQLIAESRNALLPLLECISNLEKHIVELEHGNENRDKIINYWWKELGYSCANELAYLALGDKRAKLSPRLEALQRERDGLREALTGLQSALNFYVEQIGPIHEDGCPEDDCCKCPNMALVNNAWDKAVAALKGGSHESEA